MQRIIVIIFLFFFWSCTKDSTTEESNAFSTWKVDYFFDGIDQTADYGNFYFMFNDDGTLMAHEGSKLTVGRWSESNGRLNIQFDSNPLLLKLKRDWLIVEKSASVIKLKDNSSSPSPFLNFVKQ
jgi:hypothetical protein